MWLLNRHQPSCKGESSPYQCGKCGQVFPCRQHKHRHMKTCKGVMTELLPSNATTLTVHNNTKTNYDHCNVNNGTVNNNNNITINIRGYGEEIMDHITTDFLDARLKEYNGRGIYNLIKSIHFNPDIPENHNIRKHDKTLMKVYENGDWILLSFKSAILDLIYRYKRELGNRMFADDFEKKINCEVTLHQIISNFTKFDMDNSPAHFYRCVRDIVALVENMETALV